MKRLFIALVILNGYLAVFAVEPSLTVEKLQKDLRSIFPELENPWIQEPAKDRLNSKPPFSIKRIYARDDRKIEVEACALTPREQEDAKQMLDTWAKRLAQTPGHKTLMEGRGNMSLLSYTNHWIVVEFENNPEKKIQMSGIHKKQPISFVATAHKQDEVLLKGLLAESLGISLNAETSADTPYFTALTNAVPPVYVYTETKGEKVSPVGIAYANLMHAISNSSAKDMEKWAHPDLFKKWQKRGQLEPNKLEEAAHDMKKLIRIDVRDIQVDKSGSAHMTIQMIRSASSPQKMTPVVTKIDNRWVVKEMDD